MVGTGATGNLAGCEVSDGVIGHPGDGRAEQGDVDALCFTCALPMVEGSKNAAQGGCASTEIDHRRAGAHRLAVGLAGDAHDSRVGLDEQVDADTVLIGTLATGGGYRTIDETGVELVETLPAESPLFHLTNTKILD